MKPEYRKADYFNDKDLFYFETPAGQTLYSKCFFDKGWWTVKTPYYKCESVMAVVVPMDTLMVSKFGGIGKLKMTMDMGLRVPQQLGIFWIKNTNHSNYANHYFWNDSNNIKFI